MTLLDTFCIVKTFHTEGDAIRAELVFPEDHPVYGGHFPGRPVVPGACVLQIVKELTERGVGSPLRLREAGNIKFPAALLPSGTEFVNFAIERTEQDGSWRAQATVRSADRLNVSIKDLVFDKA